MSIAFDSEKGNFSGELECGDFPDLQKIEVCSVNPTISSGGGHFS